MVGICVAGFLGQFALTNAFRYGDAVTVVPIDFMRIPLIALVGYGFYGEALDPLVFVGALLIVTGIVYNLRAEARAEESLPRRVAHPAGFAGAGAGGLSLDERVLRQRARTAAGRSG